MNLTQLRENFLSRYYFDTTITAAVMEVTFHKGEPQYRLILSLDFEEAFEHLPPEDYLKQQMVMAGILYDTGNFTTIEWLNADDTDVPVSAPQDDFDGLLGDLKFVGADEEPEYPYTAQIKQFASYNTRIYYLQVNELDTGVDYAGFIIKHSNPKISAIIKLGNPM